MTDLRTICKSCRHGTDDKIVTTVKSSKPAQPNDLQLRIDGSKIKTSRHDYSKPGARDGSSLRKVQTGYGAHSDVCSAGYRGYFPGIKRPRREVDHSPLYLVPGERNCTPPHKCLHDLDRVKFTLYSYTFLHTSLHASTLHTVVLLLSTFTTINCSSRHRASTTALTQAQIIETCICISFDR